MSPSQQQEITIQIPCKTGWVLLASYDNTGNTSTTIKKTVETTQTREVTSKDYTKSVNETAREEASKQSVNASASATWATASVKVDASVEHSNVMKEMLSTLTEVTREETTSWSVKTTEDYSIGPGDKLFFYQRYFEGPGLSTMLDTFNVTSDGSLENKTEETTMTVHARSMSFIKYIDVAYGDHQSQQPEDRVRENGGQSDDINKGHNGKYVWLVPVWTEDSSQAATGMDIIIQEDSQDGWKDIAAGAGGSYRYVYSNHNDRNTKRVVDAKLLRSEHAMSAQEQQSIFGHGWVGNGTDINRDRGGNYLYLVTKMY